MAFIISRPSLVTTALIIAALSYTVEASVPVTSTFAVSPPPASTSQAVQHSPTGSEPPSDDEDNGECRLLGPFSLLVQAALGALALLSLVYKRWKERPQRPVKVWAFDVSKQVFGSAMLHLANLLMSMFSAGQFEITSKYKPNPCSFYILNLGIDTTLGIPILIFILHILNRLAMYTPLADPPESIESGNYGQPPRANWWFKQSVIYFMGLLGMKICVFFLIQMLPFIVQVGDWALRWTEGNTAVQIFFVMLLFPVIMNAIQYYIIDIFIKKPLSPSHDLLEENGTAGDPFLDNDHDDRRALLAGLEGDDGVDVIFESDDDAMGKGDQKVPHSLSQTKEALGGVDSPELNPVIEREYGPSSGSWSASSSSLREFDKTFPSTKLTAQSRKPS